MLNRNAEHERLNTSQVPEQLSGAVEYMDQAHQDESDKSALALRAIARLRAALQANQ